MFTKYENDLRLRIFLMGDAALIGENFIVTDWGGERELYKGRTYKIIAQEGDIFSVELVAKGDSGDTMFIGNRYVVKMGDLTDRIQFVSPAFVKTYR